MLHPRRPAFLVPPAPPSPCSHTRGVSQCQLIFLRAEAWRIAAHNSAAKGLCTGVGQGGIRMQTAEGGDKPKSTAALRSRPLRLEACMVGVGSKYTNANELPGTQGNKDH